MRSLMVSMLIASAAYAAEGSKRPTDEQRGKELYERHCVSCHGATAAGDGPATAALVAQVPNLQGTVKDDKPTIDLVRYGRGPMPAFEASFDTEDTRRVLKHMVKLNDSAARPEPDPTPAPAVPEPSEGPAAPE